MKAACLCNFHGNIEQYRSHLPVCHLCSTLSRPPTEELLNTRAVEQPFQLWLPLNSFQTPTIPEHMEVKVEQGTDKKGGSLKDIEPSKDHGKEKEPRKEDDRDREEEDPWKEKESRKEGDSWKEKDPGEVEDWTMKEEKSCRETDPRKEKDRAMKEKVPGKSEESSRRDKESGKEAEAEKRDKRIGCKGNGKSITANTILGKEVFKVSSFKGGTEKQQTSKVRFRAPPWNKSTEIKVSLTDTPGVSGQMTESEFKQLEAAVKGSPKGFDAIVLVWSANTTASRKEEEENAFKSLHRLFGDSLCDHLLIIVTGIKQNDIPEYCKYLPQSLRHIKENCHAIIGFDNNKKEETVGSIWELFNNSQQISRKYGRYKEEHLSKECQAPAPGDELRIALIGKTGAGKSSTANSIVGEEKFGAASGPSSETKQCAYGSREKGDRKIAVVDTPGVWDTEDSIEDISQEIARITTIFSAGLHALLLVIKAGRFTKEEERAVDILREIFGDHFLRYVVIVITHKDQLAEDKKLGGDFKQYLKEAPQKLKDLLKNCERRHLSFDNRTKDETLKRIQVTKLVKLVDETVRSNGGVPFTDINFRDGQKEKEKIKEEIREEEMGLNESPNRAFRLLSQRYMHLLGKDVYPPVLQRLSQYTCPPTLHLFYQLQTR
ncbi:GIMAP7 [Branchiostoma lanceolatum]|uniref:GIMAP7 protein n=1 Tax=Branchiostoma lanceolatum TaxID=7740 RepID=A0A8J9VBR3_BRALA|nr:GIMAP7 [Branchiostoma lanceolatum]